MKNWLLIILLAGSISFLTACNGDHSTRSNIDTVKNAYGADVNDTTGASNKSIDTGKMTSADNSASGGTKINKDTTKQKALPKK
jgi:hypothetical protein